MEDAAAYPTHSGAAGTVTPALLPALVSLQVRVATRRFLLSCPIALLTAHWVDLFVWLRQYLGALSTVTPVASPFVQVFPIHLIAACTVSLPMPHTVNPVCPVHVDPYGRIAQ